MVDITAKRSNFEWTRDNLFELKKCWDYDKMTQEECAKHFGLRSNPIAGAIDRYRDQYGFETRIQRAFSHNHVVAKINKKRNPALLKATQNSMRRPSRAEKIAQGRINSGFVDGLKVENIKSRMEFKNRLAVHEKEVFKETNEEGRTIFELDDDSCRWPTGDKYCGRTAMTGKPYCAQHCVVASRK